MTKYILSADVTISLSIELQAETEGEAIEAAQEAGMQSFCWHCASTDETEVWTFSGELDGEAANIAIESARELEKDD